MARINSPSRDHGRQPSAWFFQLALVTFFAIAWPVHADTDFDGDGLCDVWQQRFHAHGLNPNGDEDLDGCSNFVESIAGTDPHDPQDCHGVKGVEATPTDVVFDFEAEKGKSYQIMSAANPTASTWDPEGSEWKAPADGPQTLSVSRPSGPLRFYKLAVKDVDTDTDGVSDWAEGKMGTDPTLAASPSNASGGVASDGETLESLMSITVSVIDAAAAEKEGSSARVRLQRTVGSMPLTLPLSTVGAADPEKSSALPADYALKDGSGGALSGQLALGSGQNSADVVVEPVLDAEVEVPEELGLRFELPGLASGDPIATGVVEVTDAEVAPANRKLYVAYLGREAGVSTTATGIATALVEGDNDLALIAITFSNLTSEQNTAYIRIGNDLEVFNIPRGQVSGVGWQIRAAQIATTDQAMLNALRNGDLYVSITSAEYPTGEIRGYFQRANGSETPPTPPAPPTLGSAEFPDLTGFDLDRDIYRFLTQSTFGPTTDLYNEVKTLVDAAQSGGGTYLDGLEAWIDQQMDPVQTPSPSWMKLTQGADLEEFLIRNCAAINDNNDPQFEGNSFNVSNNAVNNVDNNNRPNHINARREWWTLVTQAPDQLRQRMAQALTEICVISDNDGTVRDRHYGMTNYWDNMATNAFGKYRDLLEDVTYSPMMGVYLSHLKNRKASGSVFPDENYAREIMQLFTIGLVLRHDDGSLVLGSNGLPVPTYDQDDITELARVMTGLSFSTRHSVVTGAPRYPNPSNQRIGTPETNTNFFEGNGLRYWQAPWLNPMKIFTSYHDYSAKTLFSGKVGQKTIPARSVSVANGNNDLRDAHNALAGNPYATDYDAGGGHPNTPVFISRLLVQRFTSANPSAGYLYRVTQAYKQSNGNLGDVIKAILLDYEARSLTLADQIGAGKPKETLLHYTAVMRALKAKSGVPLSSLRTDTLTGYLPTTWTTDSPSHYVPDLDPFPQSEYDKFPAGSYRLRHSDTGTSLGMAPMRAPSVFNWFLPDYVVPGPIAAAGLVAPELQIMTDSQVIYNVNALWTLTWSSTVLSASPPTYPGFGGDDFFNLNAYKKADPTDINNPSAPGATQLPIPAIVSDRGYRVAGGTTGTYLHKDRIMPDFNELYDLYDNAYDTARGGGASVNNSHYAAIDALVDQVDLWFCSGYLKHKWGGTPTVDSPRKALIDFCRSLRRQDKSTSATNYRNDLVNRVRYVSYLISTSPQALVMH
ncbi:MAG: DUF1800 family protein [Verrucomicrobiales bacterium]|nr:DUF1800 family protein [Verrucomicrobiales bacterium]